MERLIAGFEDKHASRGLPKRASMMSLKGKRDQESALLSMA
jgi:hypothetical protein